MSNLGTLIQIARTFGLRDGMLRLSYELQRGSGLISLRAQAAAGWGRWSLGRIAPGTRPEDALKRRREGERPFFFRNARELAPCLKSILAPEQQSAVVAEAEKILKGQLPYFGPLSFACGFPPNWFQNPATGQHVAPQRHWTTMRFASPEYGDLKFILEPSRFLFVYPLARAYALSGEERFAEGFWQALEDWARKSPPMAGPLWICGQESALRIIAWSFATGAFLHSPSTTPERMELVLSMIAAHAWRTEQTVGYARSQRSNHLISEGVGLWTAGTLYPELAEAGKWQDLGAQLVLEAVRDQITEDGLYLQRSFNYQRMALHLLLWMLRLADVHNLKLHDDISARTAASLDFLRAFVDPISGHAPNHGANDGSLVLPLATADFLDFRPLLQLGNAMLGRPAGFGSGPWNEAAVWLCGSIPQAGEVCEAAPPAAVTGYHRLGNVKSWALVHASPHTRRPFQADQLHVDLWWNGMDLARDPGTYLYNGEPPYDNGFARTLVHNTVTVDGQDQMRRAGRFLWVDWAQATAQGGTHPSGAWVGHPSNSGNLTVLRYFEGEHDGYARIGVRHRRTVKWLAESGWVVVDDVLGDGEHEVRLHWLLADLPLTPLSESPFQVELAAQGTPLRWSIFSKSAGHTAILRAGRQLAGTAAESDAALLGWESPTYGQLCPAISIVYRVRARLPVRFVTSVFPAEELLCELEEDSLVLRRKNERWHEVSLVPQSSGSGENTDRIVTLSAAKGLLSSQRTAGPSAPLRSASG